MMNQNASMEFECRLACVRAEARLIMLCMRTSGMDFAVSDVNVETVVSWWALRRACGWEVSFIDAVRACIAEGELRP